jgi:hypothetical protein
VLLTGFILYGVLLIHPQPLFAYSISRENLTLHAREPLPDGASAVLEDALARVHRSPLYDASLPHHIFLCQSMPLFTLFATGHSRARGVTLDYLNGNIFIGPSSVERNEVYGPSGRAAGPDRPLSYYIAHEVTHHMTSASVGRWRYFRLPAWKREGYADYVARGEVVDVGAGAQRMRNAEREMDPRRSGLYLRYRLEAAFLLQYEHENVRGFFEGAMPAQEVDEAILAAYPAP